MKDTQRHWRVVAAALAFALTIAGLFAPQPALAGTTGAVAGTVRDASSSAPVANVVVTATSPSGEASATTDARGFYNIASLLPDTYTVSFSKNGYEPRSVAGVVVFADQTFRVDQSLAAAIKQIASVRARSSANLVQPGQTADVYNLSAQQFQAAQGADNLHKTLYQYLQSVPGVTMLGAGGVPRIRGGNATGVAYELDGIPINDRLTGLFTTNLSNLGVNSVELFAGGYNARYGHSAQGVINSTIKTGTNPAFAIASFGVTGPQFNHAMTLEYGNATPDRKLSYYIGFDGVNSANGYDNGKYTFPNVALFGNDYIATDVFTRDVVGNVHFRPNAANDYQFMFQNGYGRFGFNYLLNGPFTPMQIIPCAGYVSSNYTVTSGGTSISGKPCVDGSGNPSGLQFVPIDPHNADVYHHYSGIGKFQWNHNFNDKLLGSFRIAENFNQYIFDQPYDDPNWSNSIKPGDPVDPATYNGAEDFYGDRRSNIWLYQYDLTYQANEDTQWYGGVSYEHDNDLQAYYDRVGEYNPYGSAFNKNGSWPFQTLLVDYPLDLPSAYVGVKRNSGRWTYEPSIRYEHQDYRIPNSAGGSYGLSAWDPRFSLAYSLNPSTVLRGSYTVTSAFIPAAYFFNNSMNGTNTYSNRVENPYAAGANTKPEIDHNVDFSLEHGFPDGRTSFRITPYYHVAKNTLAFYKNYTVDNNGVVHTSGPNLLKTDGQNKNFGIELGLNHIEQGQNATSWFLSGTYENSWSSSQTLTTAVTNFNNLQAFVSNHTLYHPAGNPPLSTSLTVDFKRDRLHVDPYVLYQCCAYYNVFGSDVPTTWKNAAGKVALTDPTVHRAPAYFWTQLSLSYDVSRRDDNHRTTVGVLVQNLNNILRGPAPSKNVNYLNGRPGFSDGFLEQFAPGVVPSTAFAFTPDTQQPRSVELFVTFRQ